MPKWFLLPWLLVHTAAFAQSGKGTILGRVLSSDGTPAANVRVVALELPNAKGVSSFDSISVGTTDADGRYRLSDVPPGRYGVFPNIRSSFDVSTRELDTAPAVVVQSGAAAVQDISLPRASGVTVSGRVQGDVFLRELQEVFLSAENRFLRSDVALDGSFLFRDVPSGTYYVSLPVPQFVWGTREIRVEKQDISGIGLSPDDSIPVQGRVVVEGGAPVPTFSFFLEGPKGSALDRYIWVNDTVRSSGVVGVTGWADLPDDVIFNASLPLGEYRIRVAGLPAGYLVKSFSYGTTDLREKPLNLTGEILQLSIILSPPERLQLVNITGRLVRDEVLPLEIATERIHLHGNRLLAPLETAIARDGSFEISGVPPGIYWMNSPSTGLRLAVGSDGLRGLEIRNSRIRARYEEYARAASISPPQAPPVIDEPRPQRDLRARVDSEDGAAAAGVSVWLKSIAGEEQFALFGNSFERVTEGDYRVWVSLQDERQEIRSITYGSADLRNEPLRIAGDSDEILVVTVGPHSTKRVSVTGRVDPAPRVKKVIRGRVVVEGGYPLPLVALTVRPNVDAGPPFIHPYTMQSAYPTDGGFVLQADGRFAIELPEGRHRLRVDGYPDTAYRVKSIKYGSLDLTRVLLQIDGERTKELVITFSANPVVAWPKVTGRVAGFRAFPVPVRVVLESTRTKFKLEVTPRPDGSFEFPKVPPDKYTVLTNPRVTMMAPTTIVVEGRQVPQVDLAMPTLQSVVFRITADRGDMPPWPRLSMAFSRTEAYTMLSPSLVLRTAGETVCVLDVCTVSHELAAGAPAVLLASPGEGRYTLRLPEGEYRVDLGSIPQGYELQSFAQGATDLLKEPLRVGPASGEIVVSLRRR